MRLQNIAIFLLFLASIALGQSTVAACQVPVFRYALERWNPQPFEITVFRRGALSQDQLATAHALEGLSPPANFRMADVNLDENKDEDLQKLWKEQAAASLPWVLVQGLGQDQEAHTFWAGPLESPDLKHLTDSPARRAINAKLLAGESAAWVLIDGGDKEQDDASFQLLQSHLKALETAIQLPIPDPNAAGGQAMLTDLPLKLSFPVFHISRTDPAEKMFVRLLLGGDKTLMESKEPICVPVFGRGRALVCMIGKEINSDRIEDVAMFLGGECSCQVKELSPGYDLLMSADWDAVIREHALNFSANVAPTPTRKPVIAPPEPPFVASATLVPRPAGPVAMATPGQRDSRRMLLMGGIGLAGILVVVLGWLTFRPARGSKERS